MKIPTTLFIVSLLCCLSFRECKSQTASVFLIPTLHGLHKTNPNYNYDLLRKTIDSLRPDVIAVEIRQVDIDGDSVYLSKNYPYEMRMMQNWFPQKTVVGFDWLGEDIAGKEIPGDYWKSISPIKIYERALEKDTVYSKRTNECDTLTSQRMKILSTRSLSEILQSNDAALTKEFYSCLENQLKGSIHERITAFYNLRNKKMAENLKKIISKNTAKRIIILTGDDHYAFLKDQIPVNNLYQPSN